METGGAGLSSLLGVWSRIGSPSKMADPAGEDLKELLDVHQVLGQESAPGREKVKEGMEIGSKRNGQVFLACFIYMFANNLFFCINAHITHAHNFLVYKYTNKCSTICRQFIVHKQNKEKCDANIILQ